MLQGYLIAGLVGLLLAGSAYLKGRTDGAKIEEAKHLTAQALVDQARDAMIDKAAEAIAKIEVKHVTIRERLDTEIREVPTYVDCRHSPDGLRLVNEALTNGKESPNDRVLPEPDAP